jgi:hypothetical protein
MLCIFDGIVVSDASDNLEGCVYIDECLQL